MRQYIAKTIGYPIQDFFKKTNILETLKLLKESQYWDDDKIHDYQSAKLRLLVEHAYKNVPYYEDLFNKIRLKPTDIKSIDDIQKIPILTKEIVRKVNMNLVARGFDMRFVKKGKTGGTTGSPVIVFKDTVNRSYTWASYYRWYEWMGINYYDRAATFWGARSVLSKSFKRKVIDKSVLYLQNELKIDSFTLSEDKMLNIYYQLASFNPALIKGYLSSLVDFAIFLNKNNLSELKPIAVSSTTETLLPHHRDFLNRSFQAPLYDQYGCGEVSAIAYECAAHKGLHLNLEHVLCEILDDDNQFVIEKSGRVVATDLDNYVMPFIRFENGDISSFSSKKCNCGVNQPLLNSIDGRSIDTIMLKNGSRVHGVFFTKILSELNILTDQVQKFQIYQEKPGEIELRIQSVEPLPDDTRDNLLNSLKKYLNEVKYSEHSLLTPESNGKYRYIISSL